MNRRDFLANLTLAAGAMASPAQNNQEPGTVTVHTGQALGTIAADFIGLGYEISSVARPGLLSRANSVYVQLVRTLGVRGVIRIGGNTSDFAAYSPDAPAVSSAFGTVVNDAGLRELGSFLEATGWKLIWGFDLGRGSEADAIAEAKAVLSIAGERLLAFEIGNEPDLFVGAKHRKPEYGYDEWLAEYRRYKAALRGRFPRIPFAGPDAAVKTDWVTRFAADEGKDAVLLTHHYYREGQNPSSTIEKLLGVDPKLQPQLEKLSAASQACGLPYRICEVNSFSGGGRPGVSDTMAGALWVLDYMFTLAAGGCSGVNMETGVNHRDFISSYSPIGDDEHGHYSAKPEYYGMLAFSLAGKGKLLKTEIDASSTGLKAYATDPGKGTLALTLINKGAVSSALTVSIDGRIQGGQASVIRLSGPSVDAQTGVTLGGAEVTSGGIWKPTKPEILPVRKGQLKVDMPAASAAIVQVA
jgi:Glycosyl hydrolase family 79 C-terminal beta domain